MLFGTGTDDVAGFASGLAASTPPMTQFNYSSGTTNIVAAIVRDELGGEAATRAFMQDRLFGPLGMTSADPRFDAAGTFIGSSFLYATARDFARFGELHLRDGRWGDGRLLPDGWTVITRDHSLSAQWEHTILVTPDGFEVLTLGATEQPPD